MPIRSSSLCSVFLSLKLCLIDDDAPYPPLLTLPCLPNEVLRNEVGFYVVYMIKCETRRAGWGQEQGRTALRADARPALLCPAPYTVLREKWGNLEPQEAIEFLDI